MNLERFERGGEASPSELAHRFKEVGDSGLHSPELVTSLEKSLRAHGFELASANEAFTVLEDNALNTRNENFTNVLELLTLGEPIDVVNREFQANMCKMTGGEGFRVAMTEGFSGEDVGNTVRTVISFRGDHLTERQEVPKDSELWRFKPKTAQVSFAARGEITFSDIEMVSFRFPLHMYPVDLLTDDEREMLEEEGNHFIVRHYIPKNKTAMH